MLGTDLPNLTLISLLAVFINVTSGFFVLFKGRKKRLNIVFALFLFNFAAFTFVEFLFSLTGNFFILKLMFILPLALIWEALLWIHELGGKKLPKTYFWVTVGWSVLLTLGIIFTDLILQGIVSLEGISYELELGPFFPLYTLYNVLNMLVVMGIIYRIYRNAGFLEKRRWRYITAAVLIHGSILIPFSFILPYVFHNYDYTLLDSVGALIFSLITVSAVVYYRLFGVRLLARYALLFIFTYTALFLLIIIFSGILFYASWELEFHQGYYILAWLLLGLGLFFISIFLIFLGPIYKKIKKVGWRLFLENYQPITRAKELAKKIRHEVKQAIKQKKGFSKIGMILVKGIKEQIRTDNITVLIFNADDPDREFDKYYRLTYNPKDIFKKIPFQKTLLFEKIVKEKSIILRDELGEDDKIYLNELHQYEASVIVPLFQNATIDNNQKGNLRGVIIIGSKKGSQIYSVNDILFLDTLKKELEPCFNLRD